jgi:DNA-binding NtrC family response regulator
MPVLPGDQPLVAGVPPVSGSPIVLVVDDDPDVGETTATDLRRAGLRVRTALNADNALSCCGTQSFDATILAHHPNDQYCESLLDEAPAMGLAVIVSAARSSLLADIRSRHRERVFAVMPTPVAASELVDVVQAAVTATRNQRNE